MLGSRAKPYIAKLKVNNFFGEKKRLILWVIYI